MMIAAKAAQQMARFNISGESRRFNKKHQEMQKSVHAATVKQQKALHETPTSHFNKLTFSHYRKLRNLTVTPLSRVNLIAGINNTGKTSLLEAIHLLCKQNAFYGIKDTTGRRGKVAPDDLDPAWLAEQVPDKIEISGLFNRQETSLLATKFLEEDDDEINRAHYLNTIKLETKSGDTRLKSSNRLYNDGQLDIQAGPIRLLCNSVFSSPFFLNEAQHHTAHYDHAAKSNTLPRITRFLKEHLLPTLSDIRLIEKQDRFVVSDDAFEKPMDLTNYGEGFQRIFFISMMFASAQNGVLLLDEFENSLHVDLVALFAPFIHELAERFNVQVFLTSHSKECIDAFVENVPNHEDLTFHALVAEDEGINVRSYGGAKFAKLVDAIDADLRRAK